MRSSTIRSIDYEFLQGRVGRFLLLALLLHLWAALIAFVGLPSLKALLGLAVSQMPQPEVYTVRIPQERYAESVPQEIDVPDPAAFQGPADAQAADRVEGPEDTPVPSSTRLDVDNTLPQPGEPVEGSSELEPSHQRRDVRRDQALPTRTLLTGKAEPQARRGAEARTQADLGERGAALDDNFSFSTTAWDYEPYWIHMKRKLYGAWNPPAAYMQGLLRDGGWTTVRAVIEKDGTLSEADILEAPAEYHSSLHQASLSAMLGAAPFRHLPDHFPDERLVVTVRFIYYPPGVAPPSGP